MPPYRDPWPPPPSEEEMWQSLDCALESAFKDPVLAWGLAWGIAREATDRFPKVRDAAEGLMDALHPSGSGP